MAGDRAIGAAKLLDDAHSWAEEGRLSEEAIGLLDAVLAPLAGGGNDESDDEEGDGDDD